MTARISLRLAKPVSSVEGVVHFPRLRCRNRPGTASGRHRERLINLFAAVEADHLQLEQDIGRKRAHFA